VSTGGSGDLLAANNLSDLDDASTARTNLGLGNSATKDVGTTSGKVAAGDDSRITGAVQTGSNPASGVSVSTSGLTVVTGTDAQAAIAQLDAKVGTSFDPSTITGLLGWWKADALSLSDGDAVASWTDSSSNSNPWVQATGGNKPIYKTDGMNGRPAVVFDGSTSFMTNSMSHAAADYVILAALVYDGQGVNHYLLDNTTDRFICALGDNNTTGYLSLYDGSWHSPPSNPKLGNGFAGIVGWRLVHALSTIVFRLNDFSYASSTSWTQKAMSAAQTLGGSTSSAGNCPMRLGEMLVYSTAVSTTDELKIVKYLKKRWVN
jgi:hypothetical protein